MSTPTWKELALNAADEKERNDKEADRIAAENRANSQFFAFKEALEVCGIYGVTRDDLKTWGFARLSYQLDEHCGLAIRVMKDYEDNSGLTFAQLVASCPKCETTGRVLLQNTLSTRASTRQPLLIHNQAQLGVALRLEIMCAKCNSRFNAMGELLSDSATSSYDVATTQNY